MQAFYDGNDHVLRLLKLKDEDGNLVADADVRLTVQHNATGVAIDGAWPVVVAPMAGRPGDYEAVLEDGIDVDLSNKYRALVTFEKGPRSGKRILRFRVLEPLEGDE